MWTDDDPPPSAAEIRAAFGVDVDGELRRHPGGFEAEGFTDGRWFLKRWRYEPDTDAALALTAALASRGLPVPAAQRTVGGSSFTAVCAETGRRYAVFPFVAGRAGTWEDDADALARAMRTVHDGVTDVALAPTEMDEWCIEVLRDRIEHPWIADARAEVADQVDRLGRLQDAARSIEVPSVVCHHDLFPHNVLVDEERGQVTALLDWGHARLAPREHDVFAALCGPDPVRFLEAYGADGLDRTHLAYALLSRALRDIAARIYNEVGRDELDECFAVLRAVDANLALADPYCRRR